MRNTGLVSRYLSAFALPIACPASWAGAQTASAPGPANPSPPEYEVATVKVNNTASSSIRISIADDVLQATNIPLPTMLEVAFDIRPEHTEKRTLPLLELAVAKEGIRSAEWKKPADDQQPNQGKGYLRVNNDQMTATGVPMDRLIRFLAMQTHMPIVDKTGLKGSYDFQLKWQREEAGPESGLHDQTPPSIHVALPEQLRLKLEAAKGPVDVLVVDHIEQPSEN